MERKNRISTIIISTIAIICVINIISITIINSFYFGTEKEDLRLPSMMIKNEVMNENTTPQWIYTKDGEYYFMYMSKISDVEEDWRKVVVNPLNKEIIAVDDNIHKNDLDERLNTHLSNGEQYLSFPVANGLIVIQDYKPSSATWSVHYRFSHVGEPIMSKFNPTLAYINKKGIFNKPVLQLVPLSGGMFSNGFVMNNVQQSVKQRGISMGNLYGWEHDYKIYYSSAKMDSRFQYHDMHDLWALYVQNGRTEKLLDDVYSPIINPYENEIVFLRKEKENVYSLWYRKDSGITEKIIKFNYTVEDNILPAIALGKKENEGFEVLYVADDENGKKNIMAVNIFSKETRNVVTGFQIVGPIIPSTESDRGEGKYILFFSEAKNGIKAYVVNQEGEIQSEVMDLLRLAPTERYYKKEE